jgi:hypothetical protein
VYDTPQLRRAEVETAGKLFVAEGERGLHTPRPWYFSPGRTSTLVIFSISGMLGKCPVMDIDARARGDLGDLLAHRLSPQTCVIENPPGGFSV